MKRNQSTPRKEAAGRRKGHSHAEDGTTLRARKGAAPKGRQRRQVRKIQQSQGTKWTRPKPLVAKAGVQSKKRAEARTKKQASRKPTPGRDDSPRLPRRVSLLETFLGRATPSQASHAPGRETPPRRKEHVTFRLWVHRELAAKLRLVADFTPPRRGRPPARPGKNPIEILQWELDRYSVPDLRCITIHCATMPNVHSPDKEPLSLQIPRHIMGRLKKRAAHLRMSMPALVTQILSQATSDVTLTAKDYEAIAKATRKAEQTGRRCATQFNDPS